MTRWLLAVLALSSQALALVPEGLLGSPHRGEAVPDPSGKIALFSLSQYSVKDHKTAKKEWNILDVKSGKIDLLTNNPNISEIVWLGQGTAVLYVDTTGTGTQGGVDLWIGDAKSPQKKYKVGSAAGPLSGFKLAASKNGDISFVASGQSTTDGKLYNPELAKTPLSSARIYDSIFVRHWNYYLTPEFQAVFSGTLKKGGKFSFDGKLKNLVSPVKYAESPSPPFGGSDDYALSPDGKIVAFMSKAPELPKANLTTSYIFLVPHDGSKVAEPINKRGGHRTPKGVEGASSSPNFSPDSKSISYLQIDSMTYESGRKIIYVADVNSDKPIRAVAEDWDRSPSAAKFTPDGKDFYAPTEDEAYTKVFTLPVSANAKYKPKVLKNVGSVNSFYFLGRSNSEILVSGSAMWSSILYYVVESNGKTRKLFYANEQDAELKGLGPNDIDVLWTKGYRQKIHSFIVKPIGFNKNKKYPLAYLIHGGPQGSWPDSWSTRWNPKVWADQGYVVILPNPTGSTGFGQKLTDDITNDWGGAPYKDLVKVWENVRDNLHYVDVENGVAAGASFGGFMMNWIQGQDLGRKFKALVSHDGTFIGPSQIATDELWFMEHDFNGTIWDNRDNYDRFDCGSPEQIKRWATPQLIIHSDMDYRLPVSEGLGLFNVLQERGVPSRFLNFPDECHWVLKPENSLVWHQQCLGWINKYSGVSRSNPKAIKLEDTTVPVVDIDAGRNN